MNKNHLAIIAAFTVILALFIIGALTQIKDATQENVFQPPSVLVTPTLTPQETGEDVNMGTFKGTLPCADCSGLVTELTLVRSEPYSGDGTYVLKQTYIDKGPPVETKGDWTTLRGTPEDPDATVYQLDPDKPNQSQYFLVVSPNEIEMLDSNRNAINSPFDYTLTRVTASAQNPLENTSWVWKTTQMSDGTVIEPKTKGAFVLNFQPENALGVQTDCNSYFGTYMVSGTDITMNPLGSTMMYCEGSQESAFIRTVNQVSSYMMKDRDLVLMLKYDSGSMIFSSQQ